MANIYLAGPMQGKTREEYSSWREEARHVLEGYGITAFSPARHQEQIAQNTSTMPDLGDDILAKQKIITRRDRLDVQQCDAVLVNFTGATAASVGTCIEMGWASAYDKPVVAIMERGVGNPHDHAMIREIAWAIVPDIKEAARLLASWLLP